MQPWSHVMINYTCNVHHNEGLCNGIFYVFLIEFRHAATVCDNTYLLEFFCKFIYGFGFYHCWSLFIMFLPKVRDGKFYDLYNETL